MPKVVDRDAKRSEILKAAAQVFVDEGYRGSNLQQVASRLGSGKSSLYHYFPTKQQLLEALVDDLMGRQFAALEELLNAQTPAAEKAKALLSAVDRFSDQWGATGALIFELLRESSGRRRVLSQVKKLRSALTQFIEKGQAAGLYRKGNAEAMARATLIILDGMLFHEHLEPGSTGNRAVRDALHAAMCAISCA